MLSKVSEDAPRNHHASVLTEFNLFLLVAMLTFIPSSHAFAQLPNLQCNDTLSLLISTSGFHLAERSCVTIKFENGALQPGCSSPDPMCCEPWKHDPIFCDPPNKPHSCNDSLHGTLNDCCCWNNLQISSPDSTVPHWKLSWRGCRTMWDGTPEMQICLNAGDYYWQPDYSVTYHCRKIYLEVSCPGCCL